MIGLYLIAAHMVGDFVLSNRWMARAKLDHAGWRALHVGTYLVPFAPIAFFYSSWPFTFLGSLFALHYLTDSKRFRSTLGDWLAWKIMPPTIRADELEEERIRTLQVGDYHEATTLMRLRPSDEQAARARVPANEWPAIPLLVDQTLHLCQLAILGGLLLR